MTTTTKPTTCTVGPSAVTGERCGKPAVSWFTVAGITYAECADHAVKQTIAAPAVGETVPVHRHGKVYTGTVVRVTRGGTVFARVTYGNGATRVVEV